MHQASGSCSHVSNNQQPFNPFPSGWWNECLRLYLKHLLPLSSTCFLNCYEMKFPAGSRNKVLRRSPVFPKCCCGNAPLNMPVGNCTWREWWDDEAMRVHVVGLGEKIIRFGIPKSDIMISDGQRCTRGWTNSKFGTNGLKIAANIRYWSTSSQLARLVH